MHELLEKALIQAGVSFEYVEHRKAYYIQDNVVNRIEVKGGAVIAHRLVKNSRTINNRKAYRDLDKLIAFLIKYRTK